MRVLSIKKLFVIPPLSQTWSAIQGLLCANGKNKLKRMIERHRLRDITTDHLGDVKQILSKYDFQTVCMASEGAAAFFIWVSVFLKTKILSANFVL